MVTMDNLVRRELGNRKIYMKLIGFYGSVSSIRM